MDFSPQYNGYDIMDLASMSRRILFLAMTTTFIYCAMASNSTDCLIVGCCIVFSSSRAGCHSCEWYFNPVFKYGLDARIHT
jgi:hypothetical protein